MWVSPAPIISEILKMAHRLSLPQPPPPLPWAPVETPNAWLVQTFRNTMLVSGLVGQRAVLQEAETSGALDLTSCPESAGPGGGGRGVGGAGIGVEGSFSLSSEAPFSWRDIKTCPKCFHVVPALGLCPSRWINPQAARTDMSSQLRFHVCPQFQCHHTKSRLIVNRPPPPPLRRLPSPLRLPCPHLDPTTSPGGPGDVLRL